MVKIDQAPTPMYSYTTGPTGVAFSRKEAVELMELVHDIAAYSGPMPTYASSRARKVYEAFKRELSKE